MILGSLVELAQRENLMTNPDYEPKPVAWIVAIGDGGMFVNVIPTAGESGEGKKAKGKTFSIPRRVGRTSGACAACGFSTASIGKSCPGLEVPMIRPFAACSREAI